MTTEPTVRPQQAVKPRRGRETVLDMIRSLGLMLVVIFLILMVTPSRKLIFPSSGDAGAPAAAGVSDVEQLAEWHGLTGRAALVASVPASWRVTAATMSGAAAGKAHLHIGWVTPGRQYFGLDQARLPTPAAVRAAVGRGSRPVGRTAIAGAAWRSRTDARHDTVLVRTAGGVTYVVESTLPAAQVGRLVGSLHPAAG